MDTLNNKEKSKKHTFRTLCDRKALRPQKLFGTSFYFFKLEQGLECSLAQNVRRLIGQTENFHEYY
jgi:hypothetical protein